MATVVIPFAGAEGKTRLHASSRIRRALAHAMLCDVLAACVLVGRMRVVTPDDGAADAARDAGADPLTHYVIAGDAEGRRPNALFFPPYYRRHAMAGAPVERNRDGVGRQLQRSTRKRHDLQ